jgi:uncharacterized protein YjiS (DUF1127 family)
MIVTTFALSHRRFGADVASHPFLFAAVLVRYLRRRLRVRNDRQRLQAMPDYLLADIGISRTEIESALTTGRSRGLSLR